MGARGVPGEPRAGGSVVKRNGESQERSGYGGERCTNNTMELTTAIEAVKQIPEGQAGEVRLDARYVVDGMNKWVQEWIRRGWKRPDGKAVKNRELWQALVAECEKRTVTFKWVKAHSGIVGNERADQRANEAVTRRRGK